MKKTHKIRSGKKCFVCKKWNFILEWIVLKFIDSKSWAQLKLSNEQWAFLHEKGEWSHVKGEKHVFLTENQETSN